MTYPQTSPYDADISKIVQTTIVDAYKSDNTQPLFPPGDGQEGVECKNNLAGIECNAGRNMLKKLHYWNLSDDIINQNYE